MVINKTINKEVCTSINQNLPYSINLNVVLYLRHMF